jgi:malonyl-ACP decarboxylase
MRDLVISGVGITAAVGQGKEAVNTALRDQLHAFRIMRKPGRQAEGTRFIGAEIDTVQLPKFISPKIRRTASWSAQVTLATVSEAWNDADLEHVDPQRIGLIIGGSNVQQRDLVLLQDNYRGRLNFLRPNYGMMFLDTDIIGLCTQEFAIKGVAFTVGAASASGHFAIIQAAQAVLSGQVDACIAVGGHTDISYWECQGLRALGAMGSDRYADDWARACRPFDQDHDGFIFGESCGAVVVEPLAGIRKSTPYAHLAGWSAIADGHRDPDPSLEGETRAIRTALVASGLHSEDIDYINTHGTGSALGDRIELDALKACALTKPYLNATKSILGHGLSSAGAVEVIATILQMESGYLHATRNLENPIDEQFSWVKGTSKHYKIKNALNLSFGFGGLNSAICLRNAKH